MPDHAGFRPGDWLADCDTCGRTYRAHLLLNDGQMPGLKVCPQCWDPKHPQELIQPVVDTQAPPWTRPEPPWVFVATPATEDEFSLNSYMSAGQLLG